MFDVIQPLCLGLAAVFDTGLLLALLERRNWPFVRVPIVVMMAGTWLWHAGFFALVLLTDLPGAWIWWAQSACMLAMGAGLLLMPCGMIHAAWRVWQGKLAAQPRAEFRHALAYGPLVFLLPLVFRVLASDRQSFFTSMAGLELPYILFVVLANVVAAVVFNAVGVDDVRRGPRFFRALAAVLLGLAAVKVGLLLVARPLWPAAEDYLLLAASLTPLVPAFLFAYFVIRYHFLQIVLERTIVYGAILGAVLLLHQIAFQDITVALPESYRLHVVILEIAMLTALVLVYRPFRERTAEALRYFFGIRYSEVREQLRRLSRELALQAGRPAADILNWFVEALREALKIDYVAGWLINNDGQIDSCFGNTQRWPDEQVRRLYQHLRDAGLTACSCRQAPDDELRRCLQTAGATLVMVKSRPNVSGLLVLGQGQSSRDLGEEETSAMVLLVEQLAITLDNTLLQAQRLAAERAAMQREKLSALGLLASSIAHEVKNPLSAIKTIATVLAEDLGPDSPHAEDIRLILGEVERLAGTTTQLLDTVRPRDNGCASASVSVALDGTLRLLRHLSRQQGVAIESRLVADLPTVRADEHSLREIFFNLLSNSLEAAGPQGRVTIQCHCSNGFVVTEVCDTGPGIPAALRDRLFEPFLTTKPTGTGLGLYAVGRRVEELGGFIHCRSEPNQGTCFTIKLPCESS